MFAVIFGCVDAPLRMSLLGAAFATAGAGVIIYRAWWTRMNAILRQFGTLVQADFQRVELNETLELDGINPFRIIAQWHDQKNNKVFVFKSASLWFDPTPYLQQRKNISVYLDANKPSCYYVDLSFLPKLGN